MRVSAIQNCGTCQPQKNLKLAKNYNTRLLDGEAPKDTVAFKGKNAVKGGVIGGLFGVAGMAALSLLSGGMATPLAYGAYALLFGTQGAQLGNCIDEDKKKEEEEKNNNG